jgi:hypothetical protein
MDPEAMDPDPVSATFDTKHPDLASHLSFFGPEMTCYRKSLTNF